MKLTMRETHQSSWLGTLGNTALDAMKSYISIASPSKRTKIEHSKSMIEIAREEKTDSTSGMSDIDLEDIHI